MNTIDKKKSLNIFKLLIEYDGTNYHGWQIQPSDPSIQNEIQKILSLITQEDIFVSGSGRTDAGVHSIGQVAHFQSSTAITPEKIQNALNKMLPKDIVIRQCTYADNDFHARFSAKRKTYQYRILNSIVPVALYRQYSWHIHKELNIEAMQQAANFLIGEIDFKAFEGVGSPRKSTVRTIYEATVTKENEIVTFEVTGNGFLKFMVRNITGTLVDVGTGKLTPNDFNTILMSKDRKNAGATAPPHGLFLKHVEY